MSSPGLSSLILCSNVHGIIHRDLQLSCFKRRRDLLLSETICNAHISLADKQPYRLQ